MSVVLWYLDAANKVLQKSIIATYRIQLTPDFGFNQCVKIIPYLEKLGISHIYLSPIFQAENGSTSGYDITDNQKINVELGGEKEFYNLVKIANQKNLSIILDIVPNHMSIKSDKNKLWMDVLQNGKDSRYSHFFDIDWQSSNKKLKNKILLPILGNHYFEELQAGSLKIKRVKNDYYVSYFNSSFPLNESSVKKIRTKTIKNIDEQIELINKTPELMDEILNEQFYFLSHWESADKEINYRRFFTINHLIGLRIEDQDVFEYVHKPILKLLKENQIDGLRIDHIDGLRDPAAYLNKIRKKNEKIWIVVEKILGSDEKIPIDWPINGTTGYDFLNLLNGLFINPSSKKELLKLYRQLTGETRIFEQMLQKKKLLTLQKNFGGEFCRLLKMLENISRTHIKYRDLTSTELNQALSAIISVFPVYRTYINKLDVPLSSQDNNIIKNVISAASEKNLEIHKIVWEFFSDLLCGKLKGDAELEFIQRLQQLTGPVMAKGAEDTTFYCYNHLISLNEVGGDPSQFGTSCSRFHKICENIQNDWPLTMLTTSTHDTKRGEDVRMRINMITEIPRQWQKNVNTWFKLNKQFHLGNLPEANTEYFLYQTLVGAWPLEESRIKDYMIKAVREEKVHTNWTNIKTKYEESLMYFIKNILKNRKFVQSLESFIRLILKPSQISSLSQTLIKYTAPGVPDLYQGTELWDLNLVDPDNRRPVNYQIRKNIFKEIQTMSAVQALKKLDTGLAKMFVIYHCLKTRKKYYKNFGNESSYIPLEITGRKSSHIICFCRGSKVITVAPRLLMSLNSDWADTTLSLHSGIWVNVFTEKRYESCAKIKSMLREFPLALLVKKS
ncbi:MAG: malto-oligosyltrehalose synthase [Planctomycetes bacterium GWF2_42_9]|nr:MAG: malto-oligosyltrehalose synthase [Planctomycetes bacterium GWF2_42_9]